MFKKRIRIAVILAVTVTALTLFFAGYVGVTAKKNGAPAELKVLYGDIEAVGTVEIKITETENTAADAFELVQKKVKGTGVVYENTRSVTMEDGQAELGYSLEKKTATVGEDRMYEAEYALSFPNRHKGGAHEINGASVSCDVTVKLYKGWYSYLNAVEYRIEDYATFGEEDTLLYYYNKQGSEEYECVSLSVPLDGSTQYLSRLNGASYGYLGVEPEYAYRCDYTYYGGGESDSNGVTAGAYGSMTHEKWELEEIIENIPNREFAKELQEHGLPEIEMTVNKGIYRFNEDGTAECVCLLKELGDDFSFLWMIPHEVSNTLTLVGTKGNTLVAYVYSLEQNRIETQVLWEAEDISSWYEEAEGSLIADLVSDGTKTYLCYAWMGTGWAQARLAVFENGDRVFEGEVLRESTFDSELLQDFSLASNEERFIEVFPEKVEITLKK